MPLNVVKIKVIGLIALLGFGFMTLIPILIMQFFANIGLYERYVFM